MDAELPTATDLPLLWPLPPTLQTPSTIEFEQRLRQWLWTGATGAVVTGPARVGKTTALDLVCSRLTDRHQRTVPIFRMTMPERDQSTITSVYRQLCWACGLSIHSRHTADHLAMRYLHCLADAMDAHGLHQALLVVDECQRLAPNQFNVFAELYDRLRSLQRLLLTVFVGNNVETDLLLDKMDSGAYAHIRGRFFLHRWTFQGLRSAKEVRDCLSQYDRLPHPSEKGRTIVQSVLPEAFDSGFRLSTAADMFWRVFRDYQKRFQLDSWGMQSFSITVNTLLTDFLPRYGVEELSEEMIEEAIRVSGLVPNLVSKVS